MVFFSHIVLCLLRSCASVVEREADKHSNPDWCILSGFCQILSPISGSKAPFHFTQTNLQSHRVKQQPTQHTFQI